MVYLSLKIGIGIELVEESAPDVTVAEVPEVQPERGIPNTAQLMNELKEMTTESGAIVDLVTLKENDTEVQLRRRIL